VLHGDLKPANVLVDGRGRIRIADFGLAGLAEATDETRGVIAGTPGYMAPEQLAGQGTSMRTDVYALGLVLYEMCTGKPALDRDGRPRQSTTGGSTITQPSEIVADLDPAIERVILRCLEEDPARRPPSAVSVAAALPGGDPLAAALAAGETPSPELGAAAGETGGISRRAGALCLAVIVVGIVGAAWMSGRTTVTAYVPLNANAHVMADRARTTLEALGLLDAGEDVEYRYGPDPALLAFVRETDRSPTRWDRLRSDRLTAILFWYRQAPDREQSEGRNDFVPYDTATDAVSLVTDPRGRIVRLVADVAPDTDGGTASGPAPEPDWARLFELAELDIAAAAPVTPEGPPPLFVDRRMAWTVELPDAARTPVRIEGGARAGVPVWFEILPPWAPEDPTVVDREGELVFFGFIVSVFVVSLGLARRNARMGRADWTGARRGAWLVAGLGAAVTALTGATSTEALAGPALFAGSFWVFYMALEPFVRRFWPEILIGWRTVLAGRVRDPIVGRDLLAGLVGGALLSLVAHAVLVIRPWLGQPPDVIQTGAGAPWANLLLVTGGPEALAYAVNTVLEGLLLGLPLTVVLVLLTAGLGGRRRLAMGALLLLILAVFVLPSIVLGPDEGLGAVTGVVAGGIFVGMLGRFGLLAFVTMYLPMILLGGVAIRFDAAPYATASYVVVGVIGAVALYGVHTALGGRSLFGDVDSHSST
jgi:serine/threonine-protein kinase